MGGLYTSKHIQRYKNKFWRSNSVSKILIKLIFIFKIFLWDFVGFFTTKTFCICFHWCTTSTYTPISVANYSCFATTTSTLSSDNNPSSKLVLCGSWLGGFNNPISRILSLSELFEMLIISDKPPLLSFPDTS